MMSAAYSAPVAQNSASHSCSAYSAPCPMLSAAPMQAQSAPSHKDACGQVQQQQQQQNQQEQAQSQEQALSHGVGGESAGQSAGETWTDYTKVPKEMDKQFEALDKDGVLRPTIINPGDVWTKKAQKALLGNPQISTLYSDEQMSEKQKAFDLLD